MDSDTIKIIRDAESRAFVKGVEAGKQHERLEIAKEQLAMDGLESVDDFRKFHWKEKQKAYGEGREQGIKIGQRMEHDRIREALLSSDTRKQCAEAFGEPVEGEDMEWYEEVLMPVTYGTVDTVLTAAAKAIRLTETEEPVI